MQRTCHLVVIVVVAAAAAAVVIVVHILNLLANLLSFRDTHDDKDGSGGGGVRTREVVQFLSNLLFVGIKSNTKQRHGERERENQRTNYMWEKRFYRICWETCLVVVVSHRKSERKCEN